MTSKLVPSSSMLLVLPDLAKKIGLNAAIVLQQVHYWLNPKVNSNVIQGKHWVYNTYEQWQQQFSFWSLKTIQRIINKLEEQGLLISFIKRDPIITKYYSIDYDELRAMGIAPNQFASASESASGQADQVNVSTSKNPAGQIDHPKLSEMTKGLSVKKDKPRQSDQDHHPKLSRPTCPEGQSDPMQLDKMTRLYNKDTKITTEITSPPLTPPQKSSTDDQVDMKDRKMKEEDLKNLIDIWNEQVQGQLDPPLLSLNSNSRQQLESLMHYVFSDDANKWLAYCKKIGSCRFLLGQNRSGFRVTLGWALKQKNAHKVLEGAIYDKPQQDSQTTDTYQPKNPDEFDAEIERHCRNNNYPDLWLTICKRLVRRISQPTFKSWFFDVHPVELSKDRVLLATINQFRRDYIQTNFIGALEDVFKAHFPEIREQHIQIEVQA